MDLFSVVSKRRRRASEKSYCQKALGKSCKRTLQVLGAKFRQDEGREQALSGWCMIWIMDMHIHHDVELTHTAKAHETVVNVMFTYGIESNPDPQSCYQLIIKEQQDNHFTIIRFLHVIYIVYTHINTNRHAQRIHIHYIIYKWSQINGISQHCLDS